MKILYIDPETNHDGNPENSYASIRAGWLKSAGHEVEISSGIQGPNYNDYDLVIINLGERGGSFNLREKLAEHDQKETRISRPLILACADKKDILLATTHGATRCELYELSQPQSLASVLDKAVGSGFSKNTNK